MDGFLSQLGIYPGFVGLFEYSLKSQRDGNPTNREESSSIGRPSECLRR